MTVPTNHDAPLSLNVRATTPFDHAVWLEGTLYPAPLTALPPDDVRVHLPPHLGQPDAHGRVVLQDDSEVDAPMFIAPEDLAHHDRSCWHEFLGTDSWGGAAWFGPKVSMESFMTQVQAFVLDGLRQAQAFDFFEFVDATVWYAWSFSDNTQMILGYFSDMGLLNRAQAVMPPDVVHTLFGAAHNDTPLDVMLTQVAYGLLVQQGTLDASLAGQAREQGGDHQDPDDHSLGQALGTFSVGLRPAGAEDRAVLLRMARRLLVDVLRREQGDLRQDVLETAVAQALAERF